MSQPPPDTEAVKAFNAKIAAEFRANNGKVGAFEGRELLLPTTTGAKSGQPRLSPRYIDAGARHLILRIGSLTARPESVAEQLLPALKELGPP